LPSWSDCHGRGHWSRMRLFGDVQACPSGHCGTELPNLLANIAPKGHKNCRLWFGTFAVCGRLLSSSWAGKFWRVNPL
jgi:hypothetical protein